MNWVTHTYYSGEKDATTSDAEQNPIQAITTNRTGGNKKYLVVKQEVNRDCATPTHIPETLDCENFDVFVHISH